MEQNITVQFISKHFQIQVKKITQSFRIKNSVYYNAVTQFGNMSLIVETYKDRIGQYNAVQLLTIRNNLIKKNSQIFPVIYQQQIITSSSHRIYCISLTEKSRSFQSFVRQGNQKIRISNFDHLIKCCYSLQTQNFGIQGPILCSQLIYFENSGKININMSQIIFLDPSIQKQNAFLNKLVLFFQEIFIKNKIQSIMNQISLIRDKMRIFAPQNIKYAKDMQELIIMLNLSQQTFVQVQLNKNHQKKNGLISSNSLNQNKKQRAGNRTKKVPLRELDGNVKFTIHQKQYSQLQFIQGKCINCLRQISQEQKKIYIKTNCHYKLKKLENLYIQFIQNNKNKYSSQQFDIITVTSPVQKIQFISFLIFYLAALDPVVTFLSFIQHENALKIQYINKQKDNKILKIFFYHSYVIKDEEISMIIERAKLKNCKLDLRFMKINDTLLMFLANCQKTLKIIQIHLSDCYGLTDNGISTLLISPFCKNLQAISLILDDGLFESAVQSLNLKSDLKRLFIQRNSYNQEHHHKTEINISKMKLVELQSIGIKVSLDNLNLSSIKILKITQPISIQQFKNLKNLRLVELKVKLIELYKKSLISSTSDFFQNAIIGKNNPIRQFAQGPSSQTLKILDLSGSIIKFKTCRYLFFIQELQRLYLDNCTGLGHQFQAIFPKIQYLSLMNTQITIQNLQTILQKIHTLTQLNIIQNNIISRQQLYKFIIENQKTIKNLLVCQKCYSHKLIQKPKAEQNVNQFFQNIILYVGKLLAIETEDILYNIMYKVSQKSRFLTMITQQPRNNSKNLQEQEDKVKNLIHKLVKFMQISGKQLKKFKNLQINKDKFQSFYRVYERKKQQIGLEDSNLTQILDVNKQIFIKVIAFENQSIDHFSYKIARLIQKYPKSTLIVSLKNNKLFTKQVIKALSYYAKDNLTQLNFLNCIFTTDQVIQYLFQFPFLQTLNEGILKLRLTERNFLDISQKILKFSMRLRYIRQMVIQCEQISQIQILFSIIYHIIDKNASNLCKLKIKLNNMVVNNQINILVNRILQLNCLQQLQLLIDNSLKSKQKVDFSFNFGRLPKIKILRVKIPFTNNVNFNSKSLEELSWDISNLNINQNDVNKIMKSINMSQLKHLNLDMSNCINIHSLNKIFTLGPNTGMLDKLSSIQSINFNFQYCTIKQNTVFQMFHSVSKMPSIKNIYVNLSYVINNLNQLVKSIRDFILSINKDVTMVIISVNSHSKDFSYNQQFYKHNGVQFLF